MAPTGRIWQKGSFLFEKIKDYWSKKEQKPLISEKTALWCAVLFTILYVAPFYLSKTLRATPLSSRDAPSVIRARIRAVILSCLASTAVTVYILVQYGHAEARDVLRLFAMWPVVPQDCLKVLALVSVLFAGPLYESIMVEKGWREWSLKSVKENFWTSLPGLRNYVVAPLSEELVFRSLVISLYLLAKVSPTRIVFLTPLIFGVAHVHHFVEFVQSRAPPNQTLPPMKIMLIGIIRSLIQFSYTSLFGFFAAFVHLRTGNVFAAVIAHMFCNFMGLPRFWGKVGQDHEAHNTTPDAAQGKRDDSLDQVRSGNSSMEDPSQDEKASGAKVKTLSIGYTVIYYALLATGSFGFYELLWKLTESSNALASFR